MTNFTDVTSPGEAHVFQVPWVRALIIFLHAIIFCGCFFGNLIVIIVVTMSRRLRSITNFLLANLAVADLCVGIFCVFQNLYIQLTESWVLGEAMCKMFQFVHSLSYTSSILILVVICTERYVAIIHPIACKRILTPTRLMLVVAVVWLLSAAYSAPRLGWMQTVLMPQPNGSPAQILCLPNSNRYNRELFDTLTFVLLYVIPLAAMTVLYSRIAVALWRSSHGLAGAYCHQLQNGSMRFSAQRHQSRVTLRGRRPVTSVDAEASPSQHQHTVSSLHVLRARRGVVRMLIAVVLTFAVCNLPLHARKMWQNWSPDYQGGTPFSAVFSLVTFLATYVNAAMDPLLYAFMSKNFRRGTRELVCGSPTQARARSCSPLQRRSSSRSTTRVVGSSNS